MNNSSRLQTALALIPVIESGLRDKKMTPEKASLMASFCEWVGESAETSLPERQTLLEGLERLKAQLAQS